jgi:NitT/TauT family transport system ATP-binding protein
LNTSESPKIEVASLSFGYSGVRVFEHFSWETDALVNILQGPSGCGKTTLLRLLAGQLVAQEGTLLGLTGPARLILQDDALFPWLSVEENLSLSPEWRGWAGICSALADLARVVEPLRRRRVAQLSFGQRRGVELLRVLASGAGTLLLDEPLNFLDSAKRSVVVECCRNLASQGTAFVVTSHYEADFASLEAARFSFGTDLPVTSLRPL